MGIIKEFPCGVCGFEFEADEYDSGGRNKCPSCGAIHNYDEGLLPEAQGFKSIIASQAETIDDLIEERDHCRGGERSAISILCELTGRDYIEVVMMIAANTASKALVDTSVVSNERYDNRNDRMNNQYAAITNATGENPGFSVTFKNGIDAEPDIKFSGLSIDCAGESAVYGALLACSNWLKNHCEELKLMDQIKYDIDPLLGSDGLLNATFSNGVATKVEEKND